MMEKPKETAFRRERIVPPLPLALCSYYDLQCVVSLLRLLS